MDVMNDPEQMPGNDRKDNRHYEELAPSALNGQKAQRREFFTAAPIKVTRSTAAGGDEKPRAVIEGYALVFGSRSLPLWEENGKPAREVIDPAAVTMELLDGCDIRMSMYHDDRHMLARSIQGRGSLAYLIDEKGVKFTFEAPEHYRGEEALEMIERGELNGCSFAFATNYEAPECVERSETKREIIYTVKKIFRVYDFTLTPDPAYPATQVEARDAALSRSDVFLSMLEAQSKRPGGEYRWREQVEEMRRLCGK